MQKFVIVTADDFGLHEAVNEAVAQACQSGVLTAASLMVAAPAADDAVRRARQLPNLRVGEALSGDYGVMQSLRVVIVNPSRFGQAIALYANPRGGDATGTFIIDDTIVQAHRLTAYSRYKIWQETIAPGTYRSLRITTMPEGGSAYPLRLIVGPDDGSAPPGAPDSLVY